MVRSRTFVATPPGVTIKEQLNDRGMSQKEFAVRMNLSEKHVSKLVNGGVQLTPEVAVRLETVLGVPAQYWNNLEAIYREKLIKAREENEMEADAELAKLLPYSEMAKFGWVPETKDALQKARYLRKYFEVVGLSLLENAQLTKIACRRLALTEKSDFALMAWAQEAKIKAREIKTGPIDVNRLVSILPSIRKMTLMSPEDFCPEIRASLAECGVALVFLPHLKGSFLQGATFLDGNKYVVGLTAGGKDADKFWFSLFHELAHIVLGHVECENGTSEDDERAADLWSGDVLIERDAFKTFRDNGDYSEAGIIKFAKEQGIAPGIVVGRMQREGVIKYSMHNELKEKYEIVV